MKKLILILLLFASITACKKNEDEPKSYNIEVRVDDKVSYTYKSAKTDRLIRQYNSTSLPNTSYKTTEAYAISETPFVHISTNVSKEAYFEVTVTNSSTGAIAAHKKEKGEVTVTWNVKNN